MHSLKNECGLTVDEKEECKVYDAVLNLLPDASTEQISDLMTAGLTVHEIVDETKAAPYE